MSKPVIYLLGLLLFIGCAAFIYGVIKACIISWNSKRPSYEYPSFLSNAVTSISAVLATNLGAVLGITVTNPQSKFRLSDSWNPLSIFSNPTPSTMQGIACYIYIFALLAAAIVWAHRGFEPDNTKIVPLLPEMTKSLLGVIVGVLAISLNSQIS